MRAPFLPLLVTLTLSAQPREGFLGVRVQVAAPVGAPLRQDVRTHLGSGLGIVAGVQFGEHHALRVALDYTGTHVASWGEAPPSNPQAYRRYRDLWRTFRLGIDHVVQQEGLGGDGWILAYGAGIQEAWVNRTEGSFLEALLLGANLFAGGAAVEGDVRLRSRATALDAWTPFAQVGVGCRLGRWGVAEVRVLVCRYLRDAEGGLRTVGVGTEARATGRLVVLSWGVGF